MYSVDVAPFINKVAEGDEYSLVHFTCSDLVWRIELAITEPECEL